MSLRAVRSPLAPKMTMEHGATGLRSSLSRQVERSSAVAVWFTREEWISGESISTTDREPFPDRGGHWGTVVTSDHQMMSFTESGAAEPFSCRLLLYLTGAL